MPLLSSVLTICAVSPLRHVKTLESRSQLLDAALASADEANRRWEECRTIVDQLRIENATLRAALQAAQNPLNPNPNVSLPDPNALGAVNGANGVQPPHGLSAEQQQQQTPGGGNEGKEGQAPSAGTMGEGQG